MSKDRQRRPAAKNDAAGIGDRKGRSECPVIVVGIGTSAEGLKTLKQFLARMPAGHGVALVIVQRPEPAPGNLTVKQLKEQTALAVVEAKDGMPVLADRIHLMPPDKFLSIAGSKLTLQEPVYCDGLRMPIDHFFCSLAADQKGRGCGILLSGTGSDGTLGLSEIRAAGGRTFVEDPRGAEFPGITPNATDAGLVDAVLPAEALADAVLALAQQVEAGTRNDPKESPKFDANLRAILDILRAKAGHDFRGYKPNTLVRRIRRRMTLGKIASFAAYAQFLREHPEEVAPLQRDLLIGVTEFFRQPQAWEILEEKVISSLVETAQPGSEVRVWVPGCSTGKEAYSLAMLLAEQVAKSGKKVSFQIFATDSDVAALAAGRGGTYSREEIGENLSPGRLKRFLARKDGLYQVVKEIREQIVFAPQNLTADPPFSRLDLISCRNVLIYLDQEVQKKIIALFHFALREGGFLFLGNAETVGDQEDLFVPVSKKWRIYRRIGVGRPVGVEIPVCPTGEPLSRAGTLHPPTSTPRMSLASMVQQMLLNRFVPASVMIDRKFQVVYVHGAVEEYLTFPSGELTTRVVDMAREGLRARLRGAIGKCLEVSRPISVTARVRRGKESVPVKVTVAPLRYPREADGLLLITFEDYRVSAARSRQRAAAGQVAVHQLEDELKVTREELQSTIEQLEVSNDQLKASNEEVTAANEELQSANEEMETSKEELQSLNEELNTINARLHEKVEELESNNNDILNLLASTSIATVFLDKELRVRRYTPASTNLFSLIPSDLGRPIGDVLRRFNDEVLLDDARRVLAHLSPLSKEVQAEDGRWYIRRITPYRTQDDRIEGVVITFVDVCDLKQTEEALRRQQEELESSRIEAETGKRRLEAVMQALPVGVAITDTQGGRIQFNSAFEKVWGGPRPPAESASDFTYRAWWADSGKALAPEEWASVQAVQKDESVTGQVLEIQRFDGSRAYVINSASPVRDARGKVIGSAVALQDISDLRRAQLERETTIEFLRIVNQRVGVRDLVSAAVTFFQKQSGCDAVGLRLKEGDDYPYYEARGFPAEFLLAENKLCSKDAAGKILRDKEFNPVIECMCGNVISGRFDPSKPFFTKGGSFWTNCTTELLATTTEVDRQARTRNRCNGEGYESVALLPLRMGAERLGLLQLNDLRKGMFSAETISLWERLAGHLAVALAKSRTEEALSESRRRLAAIVDSIADGFFAFDREWRVTHVNDTALRHFRKTREELVGRGFFEAFPDARGTIYETEYRRSMESGEPVHFEAPSTISDRMMELHAYPGPDNMTILFRDVTERNRMVAELREAHERAAWLARFPEENPQPVMRVSAEGSVLYCNPAAENTPGWACKTGENVTNQLLPVVGQAMTEGRETQQDLEMEGRSYFVSVTPFRAERYVNIYGRDITESKQAEKTLRRYELLSDYARDIILFLRRDNGYILEANSAASSAYGYSHDELLKLSIQDLRGPETRGMIVDQMAEADTQGILFETVHQRKDGRTFPVEVSSRGANIGGMRTLISVIRDITDRKRHELRIARLTKLYAVLSQVNEAIVRTHDEKRLFGEVCRIIAEQGVFPLVWIGRVQEGQIVPEASCGPAADYLKEIRVETAGELGRGPTGTCVREDRSVINDDFDINPSTSPWRKAALRFGFRASAAFPLYLQGRVVGVLTLYAAEPGAFDQEQVNLLEALCADLSYALDAMRQEQMRQEAEEVLRRRTLELQELTETLEQRVQERTADLAKSNEMLRSETAERLRLVAAVEQAGEGVAIMDPAGFIDYVNPAFESISGHAKADILGKSYYDLLEGEGLDPDLKKDFQDIVDAGKAWSGHVSRKGRDDQSYTLDVTFSPIRDQSGAVTNYLAVERDVTQEVRLQQHLRQMQKMEAMGTLAGGIAHDLNNLLNPIFINTELVLLDAPLEDRMRQYLQMVLQAAERGRNLVKQIITFSRQKEKERRPTKLEPLIKEALKFLRSTLPQTVEIRENIQTEAVSILADPTQIHQVVMNLCSNAAYAMREKGGVLEVNLAEAEVDEDMALRYPDFHPGPYLRLTVTDTGSGMTREVMERAFDPFFTTKKPGEGSGMGLSVVHGIVRDHGGAITVYSEVGKGSTFNIFFPRLEAEGSPLDVSRDLLASGTERILLVDDEKVQVESVRNMLERLGYKVVARTNSGEALALFRRNPQSFDLVITDQTMPQMTGVRLAEELLRIRPDLPVILCTGFSETVDANAAQASGIRQFLMKPFSIRDMAEAVRRALEKE